MTKPKFVHLASSYPDVQDPCEQDWANQCAIRMSLALNGEGSIQVNSKTYREPKCRHGHASGAESLANWLWRQLSRPQIFVDGAGAKARLADRQGIIFFKNCFTRPGQRRQLGDHIDLWDKGDTKGFDDPENKAQQVWFWDLTPTQN